MLTCCTVTTCRPPFRIGALFCLKVIEIRQSLEIGAQMGAVERPFKALPTENMSLCCARNASTSPWASAISCNATRMADRSAKKPNGANQ
jgi:hypothetical protein